MSWLETGQQAGEAKATPRERLAKPVSEQLGWPVAALVILGSSMLLWLGLGASVAWIMGWG